MPPDASAGEAGKLAERLEFVGLADAPAREALRRMRPLIDAHIEPALAEFYRRAEGFPATQQFFSTPQVVQHAKQRQHLRPRPAARAPYLAAPRYPPHRRHCRPAPHSG